jgi:hypothetical protein
MLASGAIQAEKPEEHGSANHSRLTCLSFTLFGTFYMPASPLKLADEAFLVCLLQLVKVVLIYVHAEPIKRVAEEIQNTLGAPLQHGRDRK